MENQKVIIVGTGPEARIMLDSFTGQGDFVLGFVQDDSSSGDLELNDVSIFCRLEDEDLDALIRNEDYGYAVGIGDIKQRKKIFLALVEKAKRPAATAKHPTAFTSEYASIGFGSLISAHVAVHANTEIEDMVFLHSGVSVEPDCKIGRFSTLMSGVRVGGGATIGEECFIGTGAVIFPGVTVGNGAMIGAGSVVLRDVNEGAVVHGNPAQQV